MNSYELAKTTGCNIIKLVTELDSRTKTNNITTVGNFTFERYSYGVHVEDAASDEYVSDLPFEMGPSTSWGSSISNGISYNWEDIKSVRSVLVQDTNEFKIYTKGKLLENSYILNNNYSEEFVFHLSTYYDIDVINLISFWKGIKENCKVIETVAFNDINETRLKHLEDLLQNWIKNNDKVS